MRPAAPLADGQRFEGVETRLIEQVQPVFRILTRSTDMEYSDTAADIGSKIISQMSGIGLI